MVTPNLKWKDLLADISFRHHQEHVDVNEQYVYPCISGGAWDEVERATPTLIRWAGRFSLRPEGHEGASYAKGLGKAFLAERQQVQRS